MSNITGTMGSRVPISGNPLAVKIDETLTKSKWAGDAQIIGNKFNQLQEKTEKTDKEILQIKENMQPGLGTLLVSINSPKGSPSNPYNYELMVSTNGLDWIGVPETFQFAGKVGLGSEGYISYYQNPKTNERWYIFYSSRRNGGENEHQGVQFCCTKDMEHFYNFESLLGIYSSEDNGLGVGRSWVPNLLIDKDGECWISISARYTTERKHPYPWQDSHAFKQYIVPVQFQFDENNNIIGCERKKILDASGNPTSLSEPWVPITYIKNNESFEYENVIDATFQWIDDIGETIWSDEGEGKTWPYPEKTSRYVMIFKDNDACVVNIAIADNPIGPYTVIKEDLFDLPFTESGFICKVNGKYLYTCVSHSDIVAQLTSYGGWGGRLGEITGFSELRYNGPMENIRTSTGDSTYLRMRMTFPVIADTFLLNWISKKGPVVGNAFSGSRNGNWSSRTKIAVEWEGLDPDDNKTKVMYRPFLEYRNSFTVIPNTCYHLKDATEINFNPTHTSGCTHFNLRGIVPCKVKIGDIIVYETKRNWRRQWYWDGWNWIPESDANGIPAYGDANLYVIDEQNGEQKTILTAGEFNGVNRLFRYAYNNGILQLSGTPYLKESIEVTGQFLDVPIGKTEQLGLPSEFRIRERGTQLVISTGKGIVGEILFTPNQIEGTKDSYNIVFRVYQSLKTTDWLEICAPPVFI